MILGVLTATALLVVPFWLLLDSQAWQAALINALWCLFNLILVIAACLVAFEQPQLRQSHRLPRKLTAIIHSNNQSWKGKTVNVSETGAQILLDVWPNIPDEVQIELVGDYGAGVLLNAQIVRAIATSQLQTSLSVNFINPSRTQLDDLIVVLYSDVKEWYSQNRAERDNPITSLRFISTSLRRVFQEFQPEVGVKVRKQVQAVAQLYWEGWAGHSYTATITEVGVQDLRLEIDHMLVLDREMVQQTKPLISLLVAGKDHAPQSLLAQVQAVEILFNSAARSTLSEETTQRFAIELTFPESLHRQQQGKIKQLLGSVN